MRASMDSETCKSEQAEEAAARWFARQQSEAWTEADQAQFEAWLAAATAHRIQYIRVTTAWEQSARMKALGAGVPAGEIPPRGSWGDARFLAGPMGAESSLSKTTTLESEAAPAPRVANVPGRRFSRRPIFATAAAVACLAVVTYLFNAGVFAGGAHYSTAIGEMQNVSLADGSTVTLNTDTSIRVALTDRERHIRLEKGEAFFDVAKDKTRPFIVYAGEKRVMAVGTKFSVRRDRDDIEVVVTEGRVNLAASPDQPLISPAAPGGIAGGTAPRSATSTPATFLDAGAIARTQNSEVLVRPDAAREAEKLLSWRRGYVYFDNVALADAVAEFNRYNTRKIFIEDPGIAAIRVGGNFHSTNIDAFLDLIQSGFPIIVEQDGERVTLKGR
jgi:transmembrane sensor